jgi:predicted PurR-regulated permease PerM
VAVLFQPWYAALKKALHDRSGAAAAIIVLLAVAIILVPLSFMGLQMFAEAQGLYNQLASGGASAVPTIVWFRTAIHQWLPSLNIDLTSYVQQVLGFLIGDIGCSARSKHSFFHSSPFIIF